MILFADYAIVYISYDKLTTQARNNASVIQQHTFRIFQTFCKRYVRDRFVTIAQFYIAQFAIYQARAVMVHIVIYCGFTQPRALLKFRHRVLFQALLRGVTRTDVPAGYIVEDLPRVKTRTVRIASAKSGTQQLKTIIVRPHMFYNMVVIPHCCFCLASHITG